MKLTLICGDSLEIMKSYGSKQFDLCLTDPPYNVKKNYGDGIDDNKSHEDYVQWSSRWFNEAMRISKTLIFTPGYNNLKIWATEIQYPRGIMAWYSGNQNSRSNLCGWNMWEPIILYGKMCMGKNGFHVPVRKQRDIGNHIVPKPRELYIDILKTAYWMCDGKAQHPQRIIDPFLGSGTTAIACKVLDIECVGIEIEQSYINVAKENIASTPLGGLTEWL